ncbi:hypothetical protein TELCIR_17170, partial [Teladorsagia circumcincta]
ITILNAGRRYLGTGDLRGKVFVTAGLGGMSGAQPKAATIAGCISVTAEQYTDNKKWIEGAAENRLVVGSQARILYSDQEGRIALALAFNDAVRNGRVSILDDAPAANGNSLNMHGGSSDETSNRQSRPPRRYVLHAEHSLRIAMSRLFNVNAAME